MIFYSLQSKQLLSFLGLLLLSVSLYAGNAGVFPYAFHNGKCYFLLGKEKRRRVFFWSDFGGLAEKGEKTKETAAREFSEETRFVYGNGNDKKAASIDYILPRLDECKAVRNGNYTMYFAQVDYKSASMFKKAFRNRAAEKWDYVWVEADDLIAIVSGNNNLLSEKYDSFRSPLFPPMSSLLKSKKGLSLSQNCSQNSSSRTQEGKNKNKPSKSKSSVWLQSRMMRVLGIGTIAVGSGYLVYQAGKYIWDKIKANKEAVKLNQRNKNENV